MRCPLFCFVYSGGYLGIEVWDASENGLHYFNWFRIVSAISHLHITETLGFSLNKRLRHKSNYVTSYAM